MASTYLTRTPSSASNRRTYTWSGWFKRSNITDANILFEARIDNDNRFDFRFGSNEKILIYGEISNSNLVYLETSAVYRDPNAWYHIVVAVDTTQSTQSDRVKLYVNGSQITSFSTNTNNLSQNQETPVNTTNVHSIGANTTGGAAFDGYAAHVHFTDGYAYTASTFGSTSTNGQWVPNLAPSVTYGTNGFFLKFTNASDLGEDSSGNNNDYTKSGSGDKVLDNPANVFATIFPFSADSGNISEGNLKYRSTTDSGTSTISVPSGKWYVEMYVNSNNNSYLGVIDVSANGINPNRGGNWSSTGAIAYKANGEQYSLPVGGSASTASYGSSYTTGDIIGIALDITSNTITFYKNNVSQGTTTNGPSFIQSNGSYSFFIYGTDSTITFNAGQDSSFAGVVTAQNNADGNGEGDFYYTPPSGFFALCTNNLSSSLTQPIGKGDSYFSPILYTGTGTTQSITGVGFQPDLVWLKARTQTYYHNWYDIIRGGTKAIFSNTDVPEATDTGNLQTFDTDGFTADGFAGTNGSGVNYVAWNWLASNTTASNTNGSTTSTVSVNQTSGFSVVTFTSPGAGTYTIGHGLSTAPDLVIYKARGASSPWWTFFTLLDGSVDYVALNSTGAKADDSAGLPAPTSTVFSLVNNYAPINTTSVAYCFHSVEGYSKIGKYTGNGIDNGGPFAYLGFKPSFLLVKNITNSGEWGIFDSARNTFNVVNARLAAESTGVEYSGDANRDFDFLSNGFKVRNGSADVFNTLGDVFIYMAFAENPFVDSSGIPVTAR